MFPRNEREGTFALDVADDFINEIETSSDLFEYERSELLFHVREWQAAAKLEKNKIIANLEAILNEKPLFQNENVKFTVHRLQGGKTEDFWD